MGLPRQKYCHGCNTRKELLSYILNEINFMISRSVGFASALKNNSREFDTFDFFIDVYKKGRNGNKTCRKRFTITTFYNRTARSKLPYIEINLRSHEWIGKEVESLINKKLNVLDGTRCIKFAPLLSDIFNVEYDWSYDEKVFSLNTRHNTDAKAIVSTESILPLNIDEYINKLRTSEINLLPDKDLIRKDMMK